MSLRHRHTDRSLILILWLLAVGQGHSSRHTRHLKARHLHHRGTTSAARHLVELVLLRHLLGPLDLVDLALIVSLLVIVVVVVITHVVILRRSLMVAPLVLGTIVPLVLLWHRLLLEAVASGIHSTHGRAAHHRVVHLRGEGGCRNRCENVARRLKRATVGGEVWGEAGCVRARLKLGHFGAHWRRSIGFLLHA